MQPNNPLKAQDKEAVLEMEEATRTGRKRWGREVGPSHVGYASNK